MIPVLCDVLNIVLLQKSSTVRYRISNLNILDDTVLRNWCNHIKWDFTDVIVELVGRRSLILRKELREGRHWIYWLQSFLDFQVTIQNAWLVMFMGGVLMNLPLLGAVACTCLFNTNWVEAATSLFNTDWVAKFARSLRTEYGLLGYTVWMLPYLKWFSQGTISRTLNNLHQLGQILLWPSIK